ncbi:MAG: YCF48-related protein [Syntrophorhabdaceae bacterium]|nr:YCF48-related protein [Syntrophorhabdaceae bacterium]MDD5242858.1 YCF48-related protein [Syntrophorhabdaceae bacterium]
MQEVSKSHHKTLPRRFVNNQRLNSIPSAIALICILLFFVVLHSESATLAANQKKPNYDLFSVTFPNENNGWACGRWGTVLHTADGGKTWNAQETGTDYTLTSIFFVDTKHGWAVGDEGTIIHTADGGKTWKSQKSPVPFFLMDVVFVSPNKGWVVTERTHILNTNDGGKTWTVQFKEGDFILKAVSFSDAQNGWAVGEYGLIYHTRDGGRKWVKEAGGFGVSPETGDIVADPYLFDVMAVDAQNAWAVGIEGHVTRTTDGGKTWKKVDTGAPKSTLFCIGGDKRNTINAGGDGIFLTSTDGGRTWKAPQFGPPITYSWLYGLARRGTPGFVTVGFEGAVYQQTSSGNWVKVN